MQATFASARWLSLATLFVVSLTAALPAQTSLRSDDMQWDAEQLEQALTQRGSLSVLETPLNEVVERLGTQFRVPIVLSPKKLEEAGINVDTPVTKHLEALPLESVLEILLRELDLDFTIHNHVILVSTPEHLESPDMMDMRIYPVRDLVTQRVSGGKDDRYYAADYDALIDVITTTIAPESWSDVGGPASIREFDNSAALVVSQTRRVHRQIEQLLATLRKVKGQQGLASLPASTSTSHRATSKRIAGRAPSRPVKPAAAATAPAWQVPQVYAE
jgi:hypothetical protein